jgi:acetoin:2,6-dichlorophenolindophenol oxidoreductase subunit alpha
VIETTPAVDSTAMLESMMLIRAYEEHNVAVQQSGGPGTCTSVGQEAAAVGVVRALGPNDLILTNHRSAGHLLARGADPGRMLAEVSGKATGYCKGKSGNLHISVKELGIILTSTIVGGELSLAPGVGMSLQMQGEGGIVACFFGDGAACEGVFHEALNIAAVWNLPILFVCENNQWQAMVARKQTMLTDHISDRAAAYGIEGKTVDGNDVEAVYAAAAEAVAKVRETSKPYLLETYTYRTRGHYEPDDQAYVDMDELASWKAKDPIQGLSNRLQNRGALTPAQLDEIQERVKEIIARAADFAQESPYPEPSEVLTDVYA